MKIGRNSIVKRLFINDVNNPRKPFWVFLQANKNHGICNIVWSKTETNTIRIQEALAKYQGRQYDDPNTIVSLANYLEKLLNN